MEVNNGMNNIISCLISWINDKGYYFQSYGKTHRIHEIAIIVDNCSDHINNYVMIRFLNMIKEGGFFGAANLHFFIKYHTNNYCDRTFNSLKELYRKQILFTF